MAAGALRIARRLSPITFRLGKKNAPETGAFGSAKNPKDAQWPLVDADIGAELLEELELLL